MSTQGRDAACGSEFAVIHPETGNEVSRYDTKAEADDAVRWYGETYGRNLQVREVRAGSGPVCLGIEGA